MTSRSVQWIAALVIVLLCVAAVLLAPRTLSSFRPAYLWGGREGTAGAGDAARAAGTSTARPTIYVLEQVSPIVGSGSALIESLGIEMHGKLTPVLPEGAPVPVRRVVTFRTSGDDQKEIRLHVVRGQSESVAEDHSLGWVRVGDLPPGPRGATKIAVMFQVADGAIILTAADPVSGRAFPIEASEAPPGFKP